MVKHYHHHFHFSYQTSFKRHFSATIFVIGFLTLLLFLAVRQVTPLQHFSFTDVSPAGLLFAAFSSLLRLSIAYVAALILSIPLALLITTSPKVERILLPIFDIIQSIPVLAFFPIIVLFFISFNFFEGAAIFVIFLDMVWNMVFSMIGGLKTIPGDVNFAAKVFKASGIKKLWHITLPSILPYIITGSLLAWGQGWNILIVAEVLHNYIPGSTLAADLPGLGSLMVSSIANGQTGIFIATLAILVVLIGVINFFVWQKLLRLTERYKFD